MRFVALMLAVLLTGCTQTKIIRQPYPVPVPYVPVIPQHEAPSIAIPHTEVPAELLTAEQRGEIVKSYVIALEMWKSFALEQQYTINQLHKWREQMEPIRQEILDTIAEQQEVIDGQSD